MYKVNFSRFIVTRQNHIRKKSGQVPHDNCTFQNYSYMVGNMFTTANKFVTSMMWGYYYFHNFYENYTHVRFEVTNIKDDM